MKETPWIVGNYHVGRYAGEIFQILASSDKTVTVKLAIPRHTKDSLAKNHPDELIDMARPHRHKRRQAKSGEFISVGADAVILYSDKGSPIPPAGINITDVDGVLVMTRGEAAPAPSPSRIKESPLDKQSLKMLGKMLALYR